MLQWLSGLTASISNGKVVLNWQSSGIATSYNIYRATSPGAEGTTPYQPGVSGSTFTDTAVSPASLTTTKLPR